MIQPAKHLENTDQPDPTQESMDIAKCAFALGGSTLLPLTAINPAGVYTAQISAGSLLVPESRRIARLMLTNPTPEQWNQALRGENLLQKKPATALRQAHLIRNRLKTLDAVGWELIADAESEICSQLLLAAASRHSLLLSDFLRDVYASDLRRLERTLSHRQWDAFIVECGHRDPKVNSWTVTTRKKLFEVIVRMLAEARYLDSTRRMTLTPPLLHPEVRKYLRAIGDQTTLIRMEPQA